MAVIKNVWVMMFVLCALYLVGIAVYITAVVYYRYYAKANLSSVHNPKPPRAADDLFFQRMALLIIGSLYIMFTMIASARVDYSAGECFWWNFFVTSSIAFEKYSLFLFLFYKQDILKKTIQLPRSRYDVFILVLMHFLPILGIVTASTAKTNFTESQGCKQETTAQMMTTYGIATIIDIIVSLSLLHSFLGVIKKHIKITTHERKPSQGDTLPPTNQTSSNENPKNGRKSSSPEIIGESRLEQIHHVMKLNSRSCILSICSFFFTVIWSIALPMGVSDPNIFVPLIGTVGCTDVFIDGTAMLMCSPQVWLCLWRRIFPDEKENPTAHSSDKDNKRKASSGDVNSSIHPKETTIGAQTVPV
jgi:hypothetical protein